MARLPLSLAVVGAPYANKRGPSRRFGIELCEPGEPLELRPEPTNKFDPHAIAVFDERGIQIGYLTAERAPWIGAMLKNGQEVRAVFQRQTPWGAWARAAFGGEVPTLPPERQQPENEEQDIDFVPDPDFYPDDEWPD